MSLILALHSLFTSTALAEPDSSTPEISSGAAIVIDADNSSVLFKKKADKQLYPASLTKIATAIYAIETGNLDDIVTVSNKAREVEGTRVYLEEGEQVTLKKLLQGLLINSGNDAGIAIAEHLHGSVPLFSIHINNYLKDVIGVQHTNFQNPHGLWNENHRTTATDLAKILQYAMQNDTFKEIFGTKKLKWDGESWDSVLYSHHKLLLDKRYKEVTGGKTGYIDEAGFTLATTAEKGDTELIIITLKSDSQLQAYNDTIKLMEYGFENFQTSIIPKGSVFTLKGQVYKAPADLSFTHPANEQITREVQQSGELEIKASNGKVITSFPLNKLASDNALNTPDDEESQEQQDSMAGTIEEVSIYYKIAGAVVALCIAFILFKKLKKKQRRY